MLKPLPGFFVSLRVTGRGIFRSASLFERQSFPAKEGIHSAHYCKSSVEKLASRSRGNVGDCWRPYRADDTSTPQRRYFSLEACFLPSQVPFSLSLLHFPESSPFLSFAVNW